MKMDWELANQPEVVEVVRKAAGSVAYAYSSAIEYADACQEGLIIVAGMPGAKELVENDLGALYHRVRLDLVDKVKTSAAKRKQHVSWDLITEGAE